MTSLYGPNPNSYILFFVLIRMGSSVYSSLRTDRPNQEGILCTNLYIGGSGTQNEIEQTSLGYFKRPPMVSPQYCLRRRSLNHRLRFCLRASFNLPTFLLSNHLRL